MLNREEKGEGRLHHCWALGFRLQKQPNKLAIPIPCIHCFWMCRWMNEAFKKKHFFSCSSCCVRWWGKGESFKVIHVLFWRGNSTDNRIKFHCILETTYSVLAKSWICWTSKLKTDLPLSFAIPFLVFLVEAGGFPLLYFWLCYLFYMDKEIHQLRLCNGTMELSKPSDG